MAFPCVGMFLFRGAPAAAGVPEFTSQGSVSKGAEEVLAYWIPRCGKVVGHFFLTNHGFPCGNDFLPGGPSVAGVPVFAFPGKEWNVCDEWSSRKKDS